MALVQVTGLCPSDSDMILNFITPHTGNNEPDFFTEKRIDRTGRYLVDCLKNLAKSTYLPCSILTGGVISFLTSNIPFWHITFHI